jgi:hypothetical protein
VLPPEAEQGGAARAVLPRFQVHCMRPRSWRGAQTHTRGGATPARARTLTWSSSPNINPKPEATLTASILLRRAWT